jgi:hypothetical protein
MRILHKLDGAVRGETANSRRGCDVIRDVKFRPKAQRA